MKLFQHQHRRASTFPTPFVLVRLESVVLLFFKDYQQTAKAEQLGIFRRQKWSFLSRKVNDNLCKKIFSFGYFFSSFIIFLNQQLFEGAKLHEFSADSIAKAKVCARAIQLASSGVGDSIGPHKSDDSVARISKRNGFFSICLFLRMAKGLGRLRGREM